MAKYKVVTRCHGFRKRLWEIGQIVEIDPSENPPKHFVLVQGEVPAKPVETDQMPLSALGKSPEVKGGMASSMPFQEPVARQTRKPKK